MQCRGVRHVHQQDLIEGRAIWGFWRRPFSFSLQTPFSIPISLPFLLPFPISVGSPHVVHDGRTWGEPDAAKKRQRALNCGWPALGYVHGGADVGALVLDAQVWVGGCDGPGAAVEADEGFRAVAVARGKLARDDGPDYGNRRGYLPGGCFSWFRQLIRTY